MSTDAPPSILRPLVEDLHERRAKAMLGGGEERIARQHAADKLTACERHRPAALHHRHEVGLPRDVRGARGARPHQRRDLRDDARVDDLFAEEMGIRAPRAPRTSRGWPTSCRW
jgi:hypothetical protein